MKSDNWENVVRQDYERTDRLAVPGGWIYRTMIWSLGEDAIPSVSTVYVPRPFHRGQSDEC